MHIAGAVLVALVVGQIVLRGTTIFPANWYLTLGERMRELRSWIQRNRDTNFLIADVLRPSGDLLLWMYNHVVEVLARPAVVLAAAARRRGDPCAPGQWANAVGAAAGLAYVELAGLHEEGWRRCR